MAVSENVAGLRDYRIRRSSLDWYASLRAGAFSVSAHIEHEHGIVEHQEFLSLDGKGPRAACAEALIWLLPNEGAVVAYNAGFERSCILKLADWCPEFATRLRSLAGRIVDLLPLTRANWYHRDQRGSWSLKAVLPTIAPELDYSNLAVKNGQSAQLAYLRASAPDTSATFRGEIDAQLRRYCRRDTLAMIILATKLASIGDSFTRTDGQKPA